jgi:hypothetical protein
MAAETREKQFLKAIILLDTSNEMRGRLKCMLSSGLLGENRIWMMISQSGIAPLVYYYFHFCGLQEFIEPVKRGWLKSEFESNAFKMSFIKKEAIEITRKMGEAGIPVIWLKGLWLSSAVYEHPALRVVNDIDILVPESVFNSANEILCSQGYKPSPIDEVDGPGPHAVQLRMLKPEFGNNRYLTVDLHHRIFPAGDFQWLVDALWKNPQARSASGVTWLEPSPEVGLLIGAIHLFIQSFDPKYCYKTVADTAAIIRKYQEALNWDWLSDETRDPLVSVTLHMLFSLYGHRLLPERVRIVSKLYDLRVRHMKLSSKIQRILSLSRDMSGIRRHDTTLIMFGEKGSVRRAIPDFLSKLFSERRLSRYGITDGNNRSSHRVSAFVKWLINLHKVNWRFVFTSYLVGRLIYDVSNLSNLVPSHKAHENSAGNGEAFH